MRRCIRSLLMASCATLASAALYAADIQFAVKNVGPEGAIWIMRPWVGLHDGHFSTFTVGQPAPSGVRHIAEDGITGDVTNPSALSGPPNACPAAFLTAGSPCQFQVFNDYPNHGEQASLGGPTGPGATLVKTFLNVDPSDPNSQYLSYMVMLVPSNDAFFGTDTAHPIRLFDTQGRFNRERGPIRFVIVFRDILDAGTELNTESAADTAFFGQTVPGTGTHPDPANPVVHRHPGFGPAIVNGFNIYPGSQLNFFDRANHRGAIAEVTISEVTD